MTIGNAIFFVGMFFFFMAVFFPLLRVLISWCISKIRPHKKKENFEYLSLLEKRAIKEQNSFLLELVTEHKKNIRELMIYRNISFSFVGLLISNLVLGDIYTSSLICYLVKFLYSSHKIIGIIFIVFCIFILVNSLEPDNDDIYFPQ